MNQTSPLGWHVELHLDAQDIGVYREFLGKLRVPFLIDHMGRVEAKHGLGQQPFRELLDLLHNELAWVKVLRRRGCVWLPWLFSTPTLRGVPATCQSPFNLSHSIKLFSDS